MSSWSARLASSLVLLVVVAGAVRVAYWLLAPAMPWLVVAAVLAAIYRYVIRARR